MSPLTKTFGLPVQQRILWKRVGAELSEVRERSSTNGVRVWFHAGPTANCLGFYVSTMYTYLIFLAKTFANCFIIIYYCVITNN